jgi:hypothetical protein
LSSALFQTCSPMRPRHSLTSEARTRVAALITEKPYLGPQRTAWDLQNGDQITISPSTIKRMKLKCREALLPPPPPRPRYNRKLWKFCDFGTGRVELRVCKGKS